MAAAEFEIDRLQKRVAALSAELKAEQDAGINIRQSLIRTIDRQSAEGGREWVSVDDHEPECDEMTQFLVCYSFKFLYTKWFRQGEWYSTWDEYMRNSPARRSEITHWMPLPDPPKPVSEGQTLGEKKCPK